MHMTIGKKLIFSVLVLAMLVLLTGFIGVIVLKKTSRSADIVGKEKAPVQYGVMQAALALEKVQNLVAQYVNAHSGLTELKNGLTGHLDELDMWLAALRYGTESKEFTGGPFGATFKKRYSGIVIHQSSENIRKALTDLLQNSSGFRGNVMQLAAEHDRIVQYDVVSDGKTYTLPEFLNMAQVHHLEWIKQLKDAVNIETTFTGTTDTQRDTLGKWLSSYSTDNPKFMGLVDKMLKQQTKLFELAASINSEEKSVDKLRLLNRGIGVISKIDKYFTEMHRLADETYQDLESAKTAKFKVMTGSAAQITTELANLTQGSSQEMREALSAADAAKTRGAFFQILLPLATMVVVIVMGSLMSRSLTVPIKKAMTMIEEISKGRLDMRLAMNRGDEIGQMAATMDRFADRMQAEMVTGLEKLAAGDLTFTPTPHDQNDVIGTSLAKTFEDLTQIVGEISLATHQIASGSDQVSSTSQSLSQGATEQAASIEEIGSSMTEISAQTKTNAENAAEASRLAVLAKADAEAGNQQMQAMLQAMNDINECGHDISRIIKVIDEIAFQTNLLALNAAVEAARAGQHGKGFAVVAEEVRNLAARSAKAARETSELIEGSVAKTERGTEMADLTSASLLKIVAGVGKVTALVAEISQASQEQAQGINQTTEGLARVDQVIQANTAAAEQGAAAAEELSSQADQMRQLVARFQVKDQDTTGQPSGM